MKELHLVIHFPALFRFYLFATLRSLLWGFVALLLFFFLDFLILLFHAAPLESWSLALSSHWIVALLAVLGFEIFYGLLRLLGIFASYFQKVAQYLLPGLILFALLGGGIAEALKLQSKLPYIFFVALFVLAGILLAWRWPDFERSNLIFLLGAAFLSHYLSRLVFRLQGAEADLQGLLVRSCLHFCLTGLLYINLHIRYRLQLAQGWEPVWIPRHYPKIAIGLLVFLVFFYLFSFLGAGLLWPGPSLLRHYFGAFSTMLLLRWLLLLRQAIAPANKSIRQVLMQVQTTSLFLFVFAFLCLPAMFFLAKPSSSAIANLQSLHTQSALQLALAGSLLDSDGDGNSLWPGKDPNDNDPCVRLDIQNVCKDLQPDLLESNAKMELSSHGKILVPRRTPKRSLVLITVEGPPGSAAKPKYFLLANPHPWKKFLLPSDDPFLVLSALFYRRNVFLPSLRKENTGLFSLFASFGYRTFCYSEAKNHFPPKHNPFAACQIELKGKNNNEIYNKFKQYREKKNFVHLHFQWEKMPSTRFARSLERERRRWSRAGTVSILLMQQHNPVGYVSSKQSILRRQKAGFLDLANLLLQSAGWQKGRLAPQQISGSLLHSPFQKDLPTGSLRDGIGKKVGRFFAGKKGAVASFLENSVRSLSAKESLEANVPKTGLAKKDRRQRLDFAETPVAMPFGQKKSALVSRFPLPRYTYRFEVRRKKPRVIYFDALTGAEKAIPFADLE